MCTIGYKAIMIGYGRCIRITDNEKIEYWIESNGKMDGKIRRAKIHDSKKGLYFVAKFGDSRSREYLNEYMRVN